MDLSVHTNILMMNANRQLNIASNKKTKASEKLSSGYKVNRSADDAAGLAISEKMRRMIRGLNQGTQNAQDGVSWVQIGDGALNEAHDVIHRMEELTIKSLNGTNSDDDRAYMQAEFDQLQSELDRITNTATFNEQHIFNAHGPSYFQYLGNRVWPQNEQHVIRAGDNDDLMIRYRQTEDQAPPSEVTIRVPAGTYTTQELIDEIDDAIAAAGIGLEDEGIVFEYSGTGTCNVNLENGFSIDKVEGGLSYLLYDFYGGGSLGALIGTTDFRGGTLRIAGGQNDTMSFTIEHADGTPSQNVNFTIPPGLYSRDDLINYLNNNSPLSSTTVRAEGITDSDGREVIMLASDESIITGFQGNMFKYEYPGEAIFTSVFYDNVGYGDIVQTNGYFVGGNVLTTNMADEENNHFHITSANNTLTFSPNDSGQEFTVMLAEGNYTMRDMISALNNLFNNHADADMRMLRAEATLAEAGFQGIKITSSKLGVNSKVGLIEAQSTAYATLFTRQVYNSLNKTSTPTEGTDTYANLYGIKAFGTDDLPLTIEEGRNDKFNLTIGGQAYTITMTAGTYNTVDDIVTEMNNQLNRSDAPEAYRGKLEARNAGGKIYLYDLGDVTDRISLSAVAGNNGYKDLFVDTVFVRPYRSTPANQTVVTLPNAYPGDPSINNIASPSVQITVDGAKTVTVQLARGDSQTDVVTKINDAMADLGTVNNVFSDVNAPGSAANPSSTRVQSASTNPRVETFDEKGVTVGGAQGSTGGYTTNDPAQAVLSHVALAGNNIVINGYNSGFSCKINGREISFDIAQGTYATRADLVAELQSKINEKTGVAADRMGGMSVTTDVDGHLVFTAGLLNNEGFDVEGKTTSIYINTGTGSFLRDLYAGAPNGSKSAAAIRINPPLKSTSTYSFGAGDKFVFTLTKDGVATEKTVDLSGVTDWNGMKAAFEAQGVTIGTSRIWSNGSYGTYLTLTTLDRGDGVDISFSPSTLPPSTKAALFGPNTAATVTLNQNIQDSITIDDSSNQFVVTINGVQHTATIANGTYTNDTFKTALQNALNNASVPAGQTRQAVTVDIVGGRIKLTTTPDNAKTTADRIQMTYNTGGNSMMAIFGKSSVASVTASFDADGRLVLTRDPSAPVNGDTGWAYVSVTSNPNNPFYQPETEEEGPAQSDSGSHIRAAIQGTPMQNVKGYSIAARTLTIDDGNRNLHFYYYDNGGMRDVNVTLEKGTYTLQDLEDALQEKIDAQVGSIYKVTVNENGVRIEARNAGARYDMYHPHVSASHVYSAANSFSGGFYYNVICSNRTYEGTVTPDPPVDGRQFENPPFVIGRKDVRNETVTIMRGMNDTLSLRYNDGRTTRTLSMTLDPGSYSGDTLVRQVQEKLNEQLRANGLPENLIEAGIGGIDTGVVGSNDDNALNFRLSSTVPVDHDGTYIIDGVSGTAAFSVFYQTLGDIGRAYITGGQDLSNGITVEDGENTFSFRVDGTDYTIDLAPGEYTSQELIDALNDKFRNAAGGRIPLKAVLEDGFLKMEHTKYGKRTINNISGPLSDTLFYNTDTRQGTEDEIVIQLSSEAGDDIKIKRQTLNTVTLGINSVCITSEKYSKKALERLKQASQQVSEVRSYFGATQNRIEHAINNNENKAENTTAAESRIRDADMAKEVMENAKYNILEQTASAIMAHENQRANEILTLLR